MGVIYQGIFVNENRGHSIKEFTLICSPVITNPLVRKGGAIFPFSFVNVVLVLITK